MKSTKRTSVLLADDHTIVREGLRRLLMLENDIEVIGEAATGCEAVDLTRKLRPDVVVMEIAMPQMNGFEATRQIRKASPGTKVIILSAHSDVIYVKTAEDSGASGFLIKQSSTRDLFEAIRKINQGTTFVRPEFSARFASQQRNSLDWERLHKAKGALLSSRETEVLKLTALGLTNSEVAAALGLSAKTTEKHRYSLMQKLTIHDTAGLTRYAVETGLSESNVQMPSSSFRAGS